MRETLRHIKRVLLARADQQAENFKLFAIGSCLFFFGMAIIVLVQYRYEPSLLQELLTLLGVIIGGLGAICAAVGYIGLSVLRIFKAMQKDD